MMSCQYGHVMPYQHSDFHKKEDWIEGGIIAPFANAGYEIIPFNHVTSSPDAGVCCVGEPHALGGVHVVTHPSWSKPRSYCVKHLSERADSDYELLRAWQEYRMQQSVKSQWNPQVGDRVFTLGHHGRWEVVRIAGSDVVIKLLAKDTSGPVEDLGTFITVQIWSLSPAP